jgi:uncharacterized membrane protein HdeD (DUF308 family)
MSNFPLLDACARNWWVLLLRGIFAVLFGVAAFSWPGPTLVALVFLYGAYALADGVTALWAGAFARAWWLVLSGLLGIAIGIGTFFYPGITAVVLFYMIAAWAVIRGIFEIVAAIQFRKEIRGEWALITGGIFSIIFGVVLVAYPVSGVLALVWLIGAYALVFGVTMIVLAFQLRSLPQRLEMHAHQGEDRILRARERSQDHSAARAGGEGQGRAEGEDGAAHRQGARRSQGALREAASGVAARQRGGGNLTRLTARS